MSPESLPREQKTEKGLEDELVELWVCCDLHVRFVADPCQTKI
jgi:hypothetical protein